MDEFSGSVTIETYQHDNEIPIAESIDKLSIQVSLILFIYLITYLVTWGLTSCLAMISLYDRAKKGYHIVLTFLHQKDIITERRQENFMIELKNIQIDDHIILCDIYPEGSEEKGILSVDLNSNNIKESQLPPGYEWCSNHIKHAADALMIIAESEDIPKEKMIMWY